MSMLTGLRMNRYSEEDVAAVAYAAIAQLRRRRGAQRDRYYPLAAWEELPARTRARYAEPVRLVRSGVLPRDQYEAARRPHEPQYAELSQDRKDEDRLMWLITQAMTE